MMQISSELAAAYPNAQLAIFLFEDCGCEKTDKEWIVTVRRLVDKAGLDKTIEMLHDSCVRTYELGYGRWIDIERAKREHFTSDFRKYLMAKLGMM